MKSNKLIGCLFLLSLLSARGSRTTDYDTMGIFEAAEVLVSAETSGRLLCSDIGEGTWLTSSEEMESIDTVQLYLKKLQLQASMKSVESQRPDVNKQTVTARQQIVTAQREKKRVENLLKAGAANQKQSDDWDVRVVLLERQLAAQMSFLQNGTNSLTEQGSSVAIQVAQVEDQLAKCHTVSPINGTVLVRYVEAGELAAVGKSLFKVTDVDYMYLCAYIASEQLSQVKIGNRVTIFSDYGGDECKEYPGVVSWTSGCSGFTPKAILTKGERANLVYVVKTTVENDGLLKIDMYDGVEL